MDKRTMENQEFQWVNLVETSTEMARVQRIAAIKACFLIASLTFAVWLI